MFSNNWLVDRRTLSLARAIDLKYATAQEIAWIAIFSANGVLYILHHLYGILTDMYPAIQKIGKRLSLRQQVVATAVVYLRRFYLKNSYCGTQNPNENGVVINVLTAYSSSQKRTCLWSQLRVFTSLPRLKRQQSI